EMEGNTVNFVSNANAEWLNSRGIWLTYILIVYLLHFVLLSLPFLSTPVVWTLTLILHNAISYIIFHVIKGTPWGDSSQGLTRALTLWEQIDNGVQYTSTRKFMMVIPVALFQFSFYQFK
ncbi:hypothetical protein SNEBB_006528, partial [Seison nebaliae]